MAEVTLKEDESNKMEVEEVIEETIIENSKDNDNDKQVTVEVNNDKQVPMEVTFDDKHVTCKEEEEDICNCNCTGDCVYKDCEDVRKRHRREHLARLESDELF